MELPKMRYTGSIRKSKQLKFKGLNHNIGAGDGELWDMKNLTSSFYPLLATRQRRWKYKKIDAPGGIYAWEKLCWTDGDGFYFDGVKKGTVTEGNKSFCALGSRIVIFPDKCYYDVDADVFGSLESSWTGSNVKFGNGVLYGENASANMIQVTGVEWKNHFNEGDAVTISGCTVHPQNNLSVIIRSIDGDKLYFYEYTFTLSGDAGTTEYTETGNVNIKRTVPDIEYVCEHKSRLWGCSKDTIYACKPRDIFNWNVFDGLDSDSWAVDTGSAGDFTGCASYRGYPTFFKEDHIYKVYGSIPSDFDVLGSATMGVAEGAGNSLSIAGETLFYLSRNGIVAYSGGIPQPIGAAFGTKRFTEATGGSDGLKYYVNMKDENGEWGLFVYDTQFGVWHREDDIQIKGFARQDGYLFMMANDGSIWIAGDEQLPPENVQIEDPVQWEAEFADFTEEDPDSKGVSKIQMRLELEENANVQVWLQFDSDGVWVKVKDVLGEGPKKSYYLPIIPKRADHYRLKLTGTGNCKIHSMAREYYVSSHKRTK